MKSKSIPKTGFKGLKENWQKDLKAGFSVSLIALPLCLGIALASGVPPMAGLITAIVGGLLVSRICGSFVTISGPAAGLIVITLGAAESMGGAGIETGFAGYQNALGAIVVAGIFITIFGFLKVGKFGDFFPPAAVHGMLAAIGIIIIIKQIYVALGIHADSKEIIVALMHLPMLIGGFNPDALIISGVSLAILIVHPKINIKFIKAIPAAMWVLVFAIPLEMTLEVDHTALVHLPDNIEDGIVFPSFEKIGETAFWSAVVSLALVSAIESVLSAIAVDTQDPYKRKTNLDKDLKGLGTGSSIAAALGGLPMISEIVRSSANINNGGQTTWANFFHGAFLLIFLLIGKPIIELIPLSALATMLVFTGYRLASPKEFLHVAQIGKAQFIVFLTTLITVLFTDLLIGIAAGITLKFIIHFFYGTKISNFFKAKLNTEKSGETVIVSATGALIFSNYLSFKSQFKKQTEGAKTVLLDFKNVDLMDHTFLLHFHEIVDEMEEKGSQVTKVNMDHLKHVSKHPESALVKK